MIKIRPYLFCLIFQVLFFCSCGDSDDSPDNPIVKPDPEFPEEESSKETYYPASIWNVEQDNDYQNSASQFSVARMKETANLVAFWESKFGNDPSKTADTEYRFQLDDLIEESEKMYKFYRDSLKFVEKGNSLTDKYRMNFYIYYSNEGTVYGGGAENKIGAMWLTPNRIKTKPYAAMAHEMGHAFQYMVSCDGKWGFTSGNNVSIFEMTSQYMLFQFYPNWMELENYHFDNFMLNTHKAFLHEDNMYCSPYILEYWSDKHGIDFIGKLWNKAINGEDPVMTYQRITKIDQAAFNNEILDAAQKFMTWDMDRIRPYAKNYANKHTCAFKSIGDGWYRIAENRCPQNYGYNGIRLEVPASGTEIRLDFEGIAGADGYNAVNVDKVGWGYAFVAVKTNGERVYGTPNFNSIGKALFTVPENTSYLWLVVTGAPSEHWIHNNDGFSGNDEQWPYKIKLTGTTLHSSVNK
ncbi:DUF6055 domain-containing protein [Labilibaculum manganireducens]|uniref:DUF6055 domain-containing protein n=1 Tax=Labilibaculum manganireducens TaxID=1940525 RepID=UPI0029F5B5DA|nr:DUF6055 domain-containing protein [Labilibaculum manganireducens]